MLTALRRALLTTSLVVWCSITLGQDAPKLPRVLLLGDSITIGYTPFVKEMLEGEATVIRPTRPNGRAENCSGTNNGVTAIDRWLQIDGGDWDVIHFNFGLHDLKREDPQTRAASGNPDHPRQAEPKDYEKNLRKIVEQLKKSNAKLIFATTTPVPEGKLTPHRDPEDVVRYNEIAQRIMRENKISVHDLYSFALPRLNEIQRPVNVHFTPEGSEELAKEVVKSIRGELGQKREQASAKRPNVLFFFSDDQRADFMGNAGHPFLKTPTMDRLAAEGVKFENAFVTTSICAASRATILAGVVERTHKYTFGTPPISKVLCEASYPRILREAGYRTGLIGKFGVGVPAGEQQKMFDLFEPLNRTPYFKKQPDGSEVYVEEIVGDKAIEFIKSAGDQPFCLQVCFNAPHAEDNDKTNLYPWPPSADGLYEEIPIPAPPLSDEEVFNALPPFLQESMNRDRWYWQFDTKEKYEKNVRAYFRMITGIDAIMGRVLNELERLNLADDTVVIFSSDNGYFLGERGLSGKWIHYEESLRVPLIIHDPRAVALHGATREEIVLNLDIPATILDYAGAQIPSHYQGRSLQPLVKGEKPSDWRTDFFAEHLMVNPDLPKWEGVRSERYTYARYFEQEPPYEFLHDRRVDPDQLKNFADDPKYADELSQLRERTVKLRDSYGGEYSEDEFPLAKPRGRAAK